MPVATINFTPEFLVEALKRYRLQHRGRYVGLAIKILALLLLAPLAVWLFSLGNFLLGVFFALLAASMFFAHYVDYWLARRSFLQSPYCGDTVTVDLTEAGFHAVSPKQDVRLQWTVFTKVVHFKDGFLLFQGPKSFNWIPITALSSPSDVLELQTLLRSKIAPHSVVEQVAAPTPGSANVPPPSVS